MKNEQKIKNSVDTFIKKDRGNTSDNSNPQIMLSSYRSLKIYEPGHVSRFFNSNKYSQKTEIKKKAVSLIEDNINHDTFVCYDLEQLYNKLSNLIKQNKQVEGSAAGELDEKLRDLQTNVFLYMTSDILTYEPATLGLRYKLTIDPQDETHLKTLQQLKNLKDSYIPCDGILSTYVGLQSLFRDIQDSLNKVPDASRYEEKNLIKT